MAKRGTIVVAVPGLQGGVDEATRHLFGDRSVTDHWGVTTLVTRGRRPVLAPVVLVGALARLVGWHRRGRVELLHLNVSSRGSAYRKLAVARVARTIGLPYVIQLHGGGFERFHADLGSRTRRIIDRFFAEAAHVFVLGEPFRRLVEDQVGVPAERVSVLRNAVSVPPDERADERPEPPMILFTGRLGPGKGTPELVEALGRLAGLSWTAVLVGDGAVEETSAQVAALGLDDRIEVRGWQSRTVVSDLLDTASIFVLPSHLEALSVSLLEAMAAGLCCVATPVGAHPEIMTDGVDGLLVEPGDVAALEKALTLALTDAVLRLRLGREARSTVEARCSTPVVADRLSTVYDRVLAR
ncbi:MAG: glycosyltransferase family 4 protein [Actinomycetota bacterium]